MQHPDGTVTQTRYLPLRQAQCRLFGGYRDGSGGNPMTDRGYTGHKHNDDLGLIYMNARFYVPGIARFASADTVVPDPTNPQSFNRYSYVGNNPINLIDPTGHCQEGYMGDDYEDYDCLMLAQSASHQTGVSFNVLAEFDWESEDDVNNFVDAYSDWQNYQEWEKMERKRIEPLLRFTPATHENAVNEWDEYHNNAVSVGKMLFAGAFIKWSQWLGNDDNDSLRVVGNRGRAFGGILIGYAYEVPSRVVTYAVGVEGVYIIGGLTERSQIEYKFDTFENQAFSEIWNVASNEIGLTYPNQTQEIRYRLMFALEVGFE